MRSVSDIHGAATKPTDLVIFTGDARECVKQIPDNSVALIVTSPPYNLGKSYEKRLPICKYLDEQSEILPQLHRVLRDDGSICWQVGNFVDDGEVYPLDIPFYLLFKNLGFKLRNRIIWCFGHGLHASKRFSGRYETILWFTKSDSYIFNLDPVRVPQKYPNKRYFKGPKKGELSCNPLGKNPSDVWEIVERDWDRLVWDIPNVKFNHPEKTIHPCQFPIELVERCVLALTNEGDVVFDPYMGVGSTLLGALKSGRRAIGCECNESYVAIAYQRIFDCLEGKLQYRPIDRDIYSLPQQT